MNRQNFEIISEILGKYGLNKVIAYALRFILRNPYESCIIVDPDAKVQFMDRGSEKLFGLSQGGAKDVDIRKFVHESGLPLVLDTGKPMIGRIFKVKDGKSIGSAYPIIRNNQIVGGIGRIIFHSLEELQKVTAEVSKLKREIDYLKEKEQSEYRSNYEFDDIVGRSASVNETVDFAKKIALVNTDVLILGESGTGKELFAHSIHSLAHKSRPFVKVNCPAIPFDLAESELFGYAQGAFSGALSSGKPGKFEMGNNGTVFLDEISSLPLSVQAKLLRVLQEREIERLGSTRPIKLKFKLIAATNIDLRSLVREGRFREDLYYRISRAIIHIPPLRQRQGDIPLYIAHFLGKINQSFHTRVLITSQQAMNRLIAYPWPGNVRELIHALEQAVLKASDEGEILEKHLPSEIVPHIQPSVRQVGSDDTTADMRGTRITEEAEREHIISVINEAKGNRRKAAKLLGMPRSTLYLKIKRYNIRTKGASIG
jgi:transcriptional regulator with PAS, ATPase and Fis domain